MAGLYGVGGDSGYPLALVAQHLLGVGTTGLVAFLGMRLFRRPAAGFGAGALYALAGPPLYFEGELLITTLITFLVTALLALAWRCRVTGSQLPWWIGGAALGLATQARPNALVLAAAFVAMAFLMERGSGVGPFRRGALAGAALVSCLGVMALAAWIQSPLLGSARLLPGAGGINLYLGNKATSDGMIPRQDRHAAYGDVYRDSVELFSTEVYGETAEGDGAEGAATSGDKVDPDPQAVSRYWLARTAEEIRGDPGRWLRLMVRKTWLLAWTHEIPNNKSFHFIAAHESPILRRMPVCWGLLLSLAGFGAVWAWSCGDRRQLGWTLLFAGLLALGVVLFFVNGRFRLPIWPLLAIPAGGAWVAAVDLVRWRRSVGQLDLRTFGAATAVALVLVTLSAVNWLGVEPESWGRDFFFRSLAHFHQGRLEPARDDAERAVQLSPEDGAVHFQRGTVALAMKDDALAVRSFIVASRLVPEEPRVFNNLGIALERDGRPAAAYAAYVRAAELGPTFSAAWVNAALIELRAGKNKQAEGRILHAESLGNTSVALVCARAFLERSRGNKKESNKLLRQAYRRDKKLMARLVADNQNRLEATRLKTK
ncbi:MAG: hypothetical protein AAGD06_05075 [Acidobacteriota bacterium]